MKKLNTLTQTAKNKLINKRSGESKFGQHIQLISDAFNIYEQLKDLDVQYVIFGIPESIGVIGNNGKPGTESAWEYALTTLLNTQNNKFNDGSKVAVLGHLDFSEEQAYIDTLNHNKLSDLKKVRATVANIDKEVSQLVHDIVKAGKKPIIIGGGHNNAYGNIKGTSLALNTSINAINFDAHTDFRAEEGRHSGNGFSYAFTEGFLDKYFIYGIHENYTSDNILTKMSKLKKQVQYNTFETIQIRQELKFKKECKRALEFISKKPFGIEIDCDAIEQIPSSAMTPSGFSVNKTRQFLHYFGSHNNAAYLHICEAAPKLGSKKTANQTAKLISYLITDFIRCHGN